MVDERDQTDIQEAGQHHPDKPGLQHVSLRASHATWHELIILTN